MTDPAPTRADATSAPPLLAKHLAMWAGVAIFLAACVIGIVAWTKADARSSARDARREAQGMENANRACLPSKPDAIKHYGPGWSHRPYWRVTCPDGSVQLITAYPKETK